jgi:endonuclease/exonuclease/phosphatase (EEP) superfamily protein YafD
MDRMLDKGILATHYEVGGLPIIALNTHIMANYAADYGRKGRPALRQMSQLHQLAKTVRELPSDAFIVLVGDFNLPRGSWLYEEFLDVSGLQDTLAGDSRPTYRPLPGISANYALPIDFVFVRRPESLKMRIDSTLCLDKQVHLIGKYNNFLSDHLGIISHFQWDDAKSTRPKAS